MAVHVQRDALLVLTLDDGKGGGPVDYACAVVNASYTMAAPGEASPIPVACGETVSEPGDPSTGSISGQVFKDTSEFGITRVLSKAAVSGIELDYTYTEKDESDEQMTWTGKCTVPAFAIDFAPDKYGRHSLNLSVTTSNLADYVPQVPQA